MRFATRLVALVAIPAAMTAACGGDDSNGGMTLDPTGTHHQYVLNEVKIPRNATEANMFALNVDEHPSGQPNNALGQALAAVVSQSMGELDLQGQLSESVDSGSIIVLANVQATSLTTALGVGAWVFLGDNPSPAPCTDPVDLTTCGQHLDGNGSFSISTDSPTDALLVGQLTGGRLTAGPGSVTLQLALDNMTEPLPLRLIGARVEVNVSESGLMSGKLGGAVPEEEMENTILPAIHQLIIDITADDCTGTHPNCCDAGSTGETIFSLGFDTNNDCEIDFQEFKSHSLIASLLAPDVDLLDDNGDFNPRTNGIKDSLSIGLGFSAVGATYTLPASIANP